MSPTIHNSRLSGSVWLALGILMAGLAGPALAASPGSQSLATHIQADNADFAQQTGVSTYTGHVELTRGGLTLTGARLVVTRINDRGNIKAVLTGSPANIDKRPDSENAERVTGHADQIDYTNNNAQLVLRGHAELDREGGDHIASPVITRDLDTGNTSAQGNNQGDDAGARVHITIQPDSGNGA